MSNRRKASKKDLRDMMDRSEQRRQALDALAGKRDPDEPSDLGFPVPTPWSDPASNPLEDMREYIKMAQHEGLLRVFPRMEIRANNEVITFDTKTGPINTFRDELALDPEKYLSDNPDEWGLETLLDVIARMVGSTEPPSPSLLAWRRGFKDHLKDSKHDDHSHYQRYYTRGFKIAQTLRKRLREGAYAWDGDV